MKRINKWWLTIVPAIAVLVLIACGEGTTTTSTSSSSGDTPQAQTHYKKGDHVQVKQDGSPFLTITVNSTSLYAGSDVDDPGAGNVFLLVDITIHNDSGQTQTIAGPEFSVRDASGQQYQWTVVSKGTTVQGDIAKGEQIRGQDAFAVPKKEKSFVLQFDPGLGSDPVLWDITA